MLLTAVFSCKNESVKTDKGQTAEPLVSTQPTPSSELQSMHDNAMATYKYRMENNKPGIGQILDSGVWEFKFTFANGEMTKPGELAGNWIDFDEHNKYEYGLYDQVQGSGVYHFNTDDMTLLMVDNDATKKPQEHILKIANGAMIMQGQRTYGDRSQQSKLDWLAQRPTK